MTTADDIDALLAAPKALGGAPKWVRDDQRTVVRLAVPILQSGVIGGLVLYAHASLHADPQNNCGCALSYEDRPIQRLSYKPGHAHTNPLAKSIPQALRGRRLLHDLSRLHPWNLNRTWPRLAGDNASVAEPIDPEPATFDAALTIFLDLCGIVGDLPPAPWEPRLL